MEIALLIGIALVILGGVLFHVGVVFWGIIVEIAGIATAAIALFSGCTVIS